MGGNMCRGLLAGLVGFSAATQCFAWLAHQAPELGAPLGRHLGIALYGPWMLGVWGWWWGAQVPKAFVLPGLLGGVAAGLTLAATWSRTSAAGDQAHWASRTEFRRAECLSPKGIILGGWQ